MLLKYYSEAITTRRTSVTYIDDLGFFIKSEGVAPLRMENRRANC